MVEPLQSCDVIAILPRNLDVNAGSPIGKCIVLLFVDVSISDHIDGVVKVVVRQVQSMQAP